MYLPNKYTRWYNSIVTNAQSRVLTSSVYCEKHHIIPKSLGGSNHPNNLVRLTGREHLVCHMLLVRMLTGADRNKMAYALWIMVNASSELRISRLGSTSRIYEMARMTFVNSRRGSVLTPETKHKISQAHKGRKKDYDVWNKGKKGVSQHSEDYKQWLKKHMSISRVEKYGEEKAAEITEKLAANLRGKTHAEIHGSNSEALRAKIGEKLRGKTLDEIHGPIKAMEIREKRRLARKKP